MGENGLGLGTEQQEPVAHGDHQRLHPEPVARQHRLAVPAVEQREGEFPFQLAHEIRPEVQISCSRTSVSLWVRKTVPRASSSRRARSNP